MEVKNIAYNFLIRYRINNLSFDLNLLKEISLINSWVLCAYSNNEDLMKALKVEENIDLEAFNITFNEKIFIFYNDKLQEDIILFSILHEFAHIILKHSSDNNIWGNSNNPKLLVKQEQEANLFACEVLAPSCVLNQLNIACIDDILQFSKLPIQYTMYHINNITNFKKVDDISTNLIKIFNEYILNNATKKEISEQKEQPKSKKHKYIFTGIASIVTVVIIIFSISIFNNKTDTVNTNTNTSNNINNNSIQQEFPINTNETIKTNDVFITKTGSKYHLYGCYHLKNRNTIKLNIEKDKDILKEYEPCKVCFPK